jgi:hypothetical protein
VTEAIEAEIASLPKLGRESLKSRWRELFKSVPPVAFTPDLLARGIAWRLQEEAHGGITPALRRQIDAGDAGDEGSPRRTAMRPGNRLVRRWRGSTYVVEVTGDGFAYDGRTFASLSEIARLITGTRWSGPRFFGLVP